jgi:hypothetical protein
MSKICHTNDIKRKSSISLFLGEVKKQWRNTGLKQLDHANWKSSRSNGCSVRQKVKLPRLRRTVAQMKTLEAAHSASVWQTYRSLYETIVQLLLTINMSRMYGKIITNRSFENMAKLEYIEKRLANQNFILQENKSKPNLDNACYQSVYNISSHHLLYKDINVCLPVVFYRREIWSST